MPVGTPALDAQAWRELPGFRLEIGKFKPIYRAVVEVTFHPPSDGFDSTKGLREFRKAARGATLIFAGAAGPV